MNVGMEELYRDEIIKISNCNNKIKHEIKKLKEKLVGETLVVDDNFLNNGLVSLERLGDVPDTLSKTGEIKFTEDDGIIYTDNGLAVNLYGIHFNIPLNFISIKPDIVNETKITDIEKAKKTKKIQELANNIDFTNSNFKNFIDRKLELILNYSRKNKCDIEEIDSIAYNIENLLKNVSPQKFIKRLVGFKTRNLLDVNSVINFGDNSIRYNEDSVKIIFKFIDV